jgi:protein-tyrosine phosphatase
MIDLHTHILYGVDDGARTLNQAVEMLKKAHTLGIDAVALTPHRSYYRGYQYNKEEHHEKMNVLKKILHDLNIPINLHVGFEVDEHDDLIETLNSGYTFENSKYVLIDFTMRETDISEVIYTLRQLGYHVVVAHPERIHYLNFEELVELKREGAIFQVSAGHLLPYKMTKSSRVAKRLLKHHLIDVVASDCHTLSDLDSMKESFHYVVKKVGEELAHKWYVTNPKKILDMQEGIDEHGRSNNT